MGQGGVGAEFGFTAEGNPMLALLVLIKEPVAVPAVPENPAKASSPEGARPPPSLFFPGDGDHVIRRTDMPTQVLQRAKAHSNCICKLVGNIHRISNLPGNICA